MDIKTHPVNSKNIHRAGYDKKNKILQIQFSNGSVYQYEGVHKAYYDGIFQAESPGGFLRKHIIKGGYKYKRKN